jgi:hypothetical protein
MVHDAAVDAADNDRFVGLWQKSGDGCCVKKLVTIPVIKESIIR